MPASPHRCTATALINAFWIGPLLTSKWVQKQNCVRFTLLFWAVLCGVDKAATLWCEGTMMAVHSHGTASAWGQVSDVDFQFVIMNSARMTVVTFTSSDEHLSWRGSSFLILCNGQFIVFYQWVLGSNLLFVVVCRGGSSKAGEAGRINILVKKAASVVWLKHGQPGGTGRGRMTTKLNSVFNNTSHLSVNWCRDSLAGSTPFLQGASHSTFWVPLFLSDLLVFTPISS